MLLVFERNNTGESRLVEGIMYLIYMFLMYYI